MNQTSRREDSMTGQLICGMRRLRSDVIKMYTEMTRLHNILWDQFSFPLY